MPDECRFIPLDQLVDPPVVLRLVNRESVAYMELRDSLADRGFLNSICVRPSIRFPGKYDVADGLYRVTAARELRLPGTPCIVKDLTDDDLLAIQIQANAVRPETTPMEYARQIKRIMEARPQATLAEVSSRIIHKSPGWVGEHARALGVAEGFPTGGGPRRNAAGVRLRTGPHPVQAPGRNSSTCADDAGGRVSCDGPSLLEAVSRGRAAGQAGRLLHGRLQAGRHTCGR